MQKCIHITLRDWYTLGEFVQVSHKLNIFVTIFSYSIEGHMVYFNSKYGDFDVAKDKPDGLCVVTYFAKVSKIHTHII